MSVIINELKHKCMVQELFDKWYVENYDKSGNKQHYAYGILNEVFKAGYEAAIQVNNNCIKSNVKYCSLCGQIYTPHEQNHNDAICKDCSRNLKGY